MGRLDDKIAIVTGAGGGLGRAITLRYLDEGAQVLALDCDEETLNETVSRAAGNAARVISTVSDVRKVADIQAALKTIEDKFGRLDILVNNAGITQRADFRHIEDEAWQEILDVNLTAAMRFSRDALGLLQKTGNGSIINISSIMERAHVRQLSAYSTTKAALSGMTRAMAVEYAAYDVRVNYICPGYAETSMTARILRDPRIRQGLIDRTPMNRFVDPGDVASAALFLASDDASFITGEGLTVDGGMSISL